MPVRVQQIIYLRLYSIQLFFQLIKSMCHNASLYKVICTILSQGIGVVKGFLNDCVKNMVLYGYLWVFRTFSEKAKINMLTLCREWVRICCLSTFQNESPDIFLRNAQKTSTQVHTKNPYKTMTQPTAKESTCIISQMVYYNSISTKRKKQK